MSQWLKNSHMEQHVSKECDLRMWISWGRLLLWGGWKGLAGSHEQISLSSSSLLAGCTVHRKIKAVADAKVSSWILGHTLESNVCPDAKQW